MRPSQHLDIAGMFIKYAGLQSAATVRKSDDGFATRLGLGAQITANNLAETGHEIGKALNNTPFSRGAAALGSATAGVTGNSIHQAVTGAGQRMMTALGLGTQK